MEIAALIIAGISVIIAVYGAVLSTYLWRQRHIRRLSVYLEYVSYYERYRLQITNSGYRPVTVQDIKLEVLDEEGNAMESVPLTARFDDTKEESKLPRALKDGENVIINLSEDFSRILPTREQLKVTVYDAEGNEYVPQGIREYDGKWGTYNPIS